MHSKRDNIEIMMNYKADEIIEELFDSLKNICQNNLQSMKVSEFVLNYVKLLYYKCHKIYPHCCGSYIDSPDWIENKTATILSIKKCSQYTVTVALNHEEIGEHRINLLSITINGKE